MFGVFVLVFGVYGRNCTNVFENNHKLSISQIITNYHFHKLSQIVEWALLIIYKE